MKAKDDLGRGSMASYRQPPLHCLLAFEAAARTASLSKAAGELRVTAAAITQSIGMLEDRLGLKLVRSLSPVVELTAPGQGYFTTVQVFARRLGDALHERFPLGRAQLRITASQALGRLWLAPRLGSFARRYPRVDLIVTCTERFEMVKGGGVDISLRYGGVVDADLVVTPLWTDRLVAAGAPDLVARASGLSVSELARTLPLIDHPSVNWALWLAGRAEGADVRPALMCSDLHLAIEAACQGMGIVIAPARILEGKLGSGALQLVGAHAMPAKAYQAVVSREQSQRAPVQAFLRWLTEQVAGHASPEPAAAARLRP